MFEKYIKLTIRTLNGKKLTFKQDGSEGDSDIFFTVKGDDNENATEATITLFNLSNETLNDISCGSSVALEAGYVPHPSWEFTLLEDIIPNYHPHDMMARTLADLAYGLIFTGYINSKKVTVRRPDLEVELKCLSQMKSLLSNKVDQNTQWSSPVTSKEVVKTLILRSGCSVGVLPESDGMVYDHLEFSGTTGETYYQALKQVCDDNHWKFIEKDATIHVIEKQGGYIEELGYVLNNRTGLISVTPSEETYSEDTNARTSYDIVSFLYYGLAIRHLVKIEHPILNDTCMINTIKFVSDNTRHQAEFSVTPMGATNEVKFYPLADIHPLSSKVFNIFELYSE